MEDRICIEISRNAFQVALGELSFGFIKRSLETPAPRSYSFIFFSVGPAFQKMFIDPFHLVGPKDPMDEDKTIIDKFLKLRI